jgi:hypothetical protein
LPIGVIECLRRYGQNDQIDPAFGAS